MSIDTIEIQDDPKPKQIGNKLEQANQDFAGIGASGWPDRVVMDGNQFIYRDREPQLTVDKLEVSLQSGRAVWQAFIEEANTYVKSYDGKFTTDGDPISKYPGMRQMFELNWTEEVDGDDKDHQFVLAPTSRYAFASYAEALLKQCEKGVKDVITIATATRKENKDRQRYSLATFTCKELVDAGWVYVSKKG
jgi:hypothetical protein